MPRIRRKKQPRVEENENYNHESLLRTAAISLEKAVVQISSRLDSDDFEGDYFNNRNVTELSQIVRAIGQIYRITDGELFSPESAIDEVEKVISNEEDKKIISRYIKRYILTLDDSKWLLLYEKRKSVEAGECLSRVIDSFEID